MKIPYSILIVILACSISSCDVPKYYFSSPPTCMKSNEQVLLQDEDLYWRKALVDKNPSDYRYFFEKFQKRNDETIMLTNFRNDKSCFEVPIYIDDWAKLAGMKRTNGRAYPKELYELEWEMREVNRKSRIYYIDMHKIID